MKAILNKTWFRLLVSLGLMAFLLLWLVDLPAALRQLAGARPAPLIWLAAWITLDRLVMTFKWRLLLTCRGIELGFWEALRSYYITTFAGCFLPSTIGADAMRVASIASKDRPSEVLAASVVIERALGFLAAVIAAGVGLALLAGLVIEIPSEILLWVVAALVVSALAVLASFSGFAEKILAWLEARGRERGKVAAWLLRFFRAYHDYRHCKGALAWFLVLSVAEQAVPAVGTWLAALSLDIPLSLLQSCAVAPLALLFTRIPVSVSGFGVVESLYVAFFALVGLNPTQSFLLGLIANLSIVVATFPGALFYLFGGFKLPDNGHRA